MQLPATAIATSLLAALAVGLSIHVIRLRRGRRVSLGTGGDADIERAVRAHANLVEHAPLALLLLLVYELGGGNSWVSYGAAGALVLGRTVHALALIRSIGTARVAGMALTFTCFGVLIVANLLAALG